MDELKLDRARSWLNIAADYMERKKTLLTELDAAIGDGDHGINMCRGFSAVNKELVTLTAPDFAALWKMVGMTLLSTVGGASGPLYGGFFLAMARSGLGKDKLIKSEFGTMLQNGMADIEVRGAAKLGDKTILDSLQPAVVALRLAPPADLSKALCVAAEAARTGAENTRPMLARKGRASYLGERSIGHQDPGATSCSFLFVALAQAWEQS